METYKIGKKYGQQYIECLCCGLKSYNENDITQKYCGLCEMFHDEPQELKQIVIDRNKQIIQKRLDYMLNTSNITSEIKAVAVSWGDQLHWFVADTVKLASDIQKCHNSLNEPYKDLVEFIKREIPYGADISQVSPDFVERLWVQLDALK